VRTEPRVRGKKVLLVERRPAPGWESTWAGQLDYGGPSSPVARRILDETSRVGGMRDRTVDAPVLEMTLDRLAQETGVSVLFYSYPWDSSFKRTSLSASSWVAGVENRSCRPW